MYTPFGPRSFSYSVSSTMSRSSMSTTTTTSQQHHQVTERSHWSSAPTAAAGQVSSPPPPMPMAPRMSAGDLREKMANSFANPSMHAAAGGVGLEENWLNSCKSDFDTSAAAAKCKPANQAAAMFNVMFLNGDYESMPRHASEPRAIRKVFMQAAKDSSGSGAPSPGDYHDQMCAGLRESLRLSENQSPESSSSSSSAASTTSKSEAETATSTRSSSPENGKATPPPPAKRTSGGPRSGGGNYAGGGSRTRGGKKLPLRSPNIDMEAFLKQASTRNLYLNPADRMASSAAAAAASYRGESACAGASYFPSSSPPSRAPPTMATSPRQNFCSFCKNNGEEPVVYMSHPLKDSLGKNACPILRNYVCPKCHESGDHAHTNKYCPLTQRRQKESKIRQHLSSSSNNRRA